MQNPTITWSRQRKRFGSRWRGSRLSLLGQWKKVNRMNSSASPFHLLAKPTGSKCNLDCKYCFFLSKETLYPGDRSRMSDQLLETYIRQLLEMQPLGEVNVAWQGGEPTLMGIEFFRRAVEHVERHRKAGQNIQHTIQTNGTLLDDEWCAFFKLHNVLVGLSVDGPQPMHDAYRVNKRGVGSFSDVMQGYRLLREHEVDVNILCTIHAANAEHPLDVYRFFRDEMQASYMQFIPIVERTTEAMIPLANLGWGKRPGADRPLYLQHGAQVTERSVTAEQFGRFLTTIFDEWVRRDVGKVFVQTFDVALGSWLGQHNLCIFSPTCGNAVALEHTGDLYSCDHFVEPDYLLGNIREATMAEMVASPRQREFGIAKRDTLPNYCRECDVRFACNGGCPKDRFATTPDGEPGLNYLCAGYMAFFRQVDEPMRRMAQLLEAQRAPAEIMRWYAMQDE